MKSARRISFLLVLLPALSLLGSGCALTQERVKLSYAPQIGVAKVERADTSIVTVDVVDSRTTKDKVSTKKNGWGMEMAAITSEEDVASLLKRAIEEELEHRGFQLGTGKAFVSVELSKFYNNFKPGFFSGDAVAELFMSVKVKEVTGQIL